MIEFQVHGKPKPGGSKKAFYIKKLNRTVVTEACKNQDWKNAVAAAGIQAMQDHKIFDEPLDVQFLFRFDRPKSHFGTGKNAKKLKPSAPEYPAVRPDTTKLIRSTEDALTGIVWKDDSLIVFQHGTKGYTNAFYPHEGAEINVLTI